MVCVEVGMKATVLAEPQWIQDSYDLYGWAFSGCYSNILESDRHIALYNSMVDWIKKYVVNYKHNALWTRIGDCIYVKLRKEQDAMVFILYFGSPNL